MDNTRVVIHRLTLANLLLSFMEVQLFIDIVPRIGVIRDGEVRRGINGKGPKVEGYKNLDPEMPEGQKVLYRIER